MDLPDRIIDQARLWRFKAVVFPELKEEYWFQSPVFVHREGQVGALGCGVLYVSGNALHAEIALDYAIPERLDVQTGKKYWIYPHVKFDLEEPGPPAIHYLVLSSSPPVDPRHEPIGTALL